LPGLVASSSFIYKKEENYQATIFFNVNWGTSFLTNVYKIYMAKLMNHFLGRNVLDYIFVVFSVTSQRGVSLATEHLCIPLLKCSIAVESREQELG